MRKILFAAFVLFAGAASAQEFDHAAMTKQLRANGVDPAFVAWSEVDPLCTAFMNYKDDTTEYNQCRYDKALQQVTFFGDRETCDIEALAVTPKSLRKQPRVVIGTYEKTGDSLTTIRTPKISRTELQASRLAAYNRCMGDKGWRNPRNWRLSYAQ